LEKLDVWWKKAKYHKYDADDKNGSPFDLIDTSRESRRIGIENDTQILIPEKVIIHFAPLRIVVN
jgi:hypothetical protein